MDSGHAAVEARVEAFVRHLALLGGCDIHVVRGDDGHYDVQYVATMEDGALHIRYRFEPDGSVIRVSVEHDQAHNEPRINAFVRHLAVLGGRDIRVTKGEEGRYDLQYVATTADGALHVRYRIEQDGRVIRVHRD